MNKVLFVCTGNTCRSPMAEFIFNKYAALANIDFISESAGISTYSGMPISENALTALGHLEIDAAGHISKQIEPENFDEYRLILTMTENHKQYIITPFPAISDKIFTLSEFTGTSPSLTKDISDPYGGSIDEYLECLAEIKELIILTIEKLKTYEN